MTAYLLIRLTVHDKEQFRKYAEAARGIAPRTGPSILRTVGRWRYWKGRAARAC